MKTRKYFHVVVTRENGSTFVNELTSKEVHVMGTLVRENKSINVEQREISQKEYDIIFGKTYN